MKFRGGMGELMRQASRLQRKIEKRKEELKELTFEASAGNDQVKCTVNGAHDLVGVEMDPKLLEGDDKEMALDLIVAAANAALAKSREEVDAELEKVTGGLKIPGLI
ncbi:MAG: YbaB/EbfC family nucleoid-associated protein [Deltaproteobacteria bacterium]|nr:YbaB/EbfC family nucleoid-associated protein [Deltaproteobacteria bacterium]